MSSKKKGGARKGDDSDEDLSAATAALSLSAGGKKGKKGKRGDASDDDAPPAPAAPPAKADAGGKKGAKGRRGDASDDDAPAPAVAPAVKADAGKKGGAARRKGGRRGDSDDSDDGDDAPAPSAKPVPAAVPKPAAPGAAAKKKKAKGRRGGDSSDDSDDGAAPAPLAPSGKSALKAALDSDDDNAGGGGGGKAKDKKAKTAARLAAAAAARAAALAGDDDDDDDNGGGNDDNDGGRGASAPAAAEFTPATVDETPTAASTEPAPSAAARVEPDAAPDAVEPAVDLGTDDGAFGFSLKKKKKKTAALGDEGGGAVAGDAGGTDGGAATTTPIAAPVSGDVGEEVVFDFGKKKKKKKAAVADEEDETAAGAAAPAVAAVSEAVGGGGEGGASRAAEPAQFYGEATMGVGINDGPVAGAYTGTDASGAPVGLDGEPVELEVAKALLKRLAGGTLSNKERRRVVDYDDARSLRGGGRLAAGGALTAEDDPLGLANFSVSQAGKAVSSSAAGGAAGGGSDAFENSKDVVIESFSINAHKKELFTNASLRVMHGRRYGLVGPNGQGKSTLLKHMAARAGLNIPARIDMLYVEQEVVADDTPAIAAVLKADKKRAALIDEETLILRKLDAADAAEAAGVSVGVGARLDDTARAVIEDRLNAVYDELAAMKAESSESRARSILSGLGFNIEMQETPTKHFSGGWRMRISLARALFMQPDLLLLDEPTNHLDLNAVIWLEDYLTRWKSTLFVVSHDQDFLSAVVTDIVHLEEKKLFYYKGNYDDFKEMHKQKMEKQQKDWETQQKMLKQAKSKGSTAKQAEEAAKSRAKREAAASGSRKDVKRKGGMDDGGEDLAAAGMELIARPREYTVSFEFTDPSELAPPILAVNNVSFRYNERAKWLFRDLNFGIDQKSRVAIVGPNGVGKSTLLNLLIGDLVSTDGDVVRNRFLRVGKYSQHFIDVLPMERTPVECIMNTKTPEGESVKYQEARALLGRFGLEGHAHEIPARDLSGGQKARVVFSTLSIMAPHLLILDEPTNNLDIESIDALSEAVEVYKGGVVLVSHDARLIRAANCQLWVCDKQTVAPFDGDIDDYKESLISQIHEEDNTLNELVQQAKDAEEKRLAELRERFRLTREAAAAAKAAAAK